jgi:hypothetical protein
MAAKIFAFPSTRRVAFVRRQAASMAARPPGEAQAYLELAIRRQRDTLLRKGVPADVVERDMKALECAIRCALWRSVLTPDGAA